MLDIDDHKDDAYLAEFTERRESGSASPLDRANTAVLNADQALSILGETDETIKAAAESAYQSVVRAARACSLAERLEDDHFAEQFAKVAESEALVLDTFDYVKINGLKRHAIHGV